MKKKIGFFVLHRDYSGEHLYKNGELVDDPGLLGDLDNLPGCRRGLIAFIISTIICVLIILALLGVFN